MENEGTARILLVDDQPDNLLVLEGILQSTEYQLVKAGSGTEALRHLLLEEYAVIVMDVLMPEMNGFETAKLIQQRAKSRLTPIIFLTAYSRNELDIAEGYTAGAVDFLSKPVDPIILRSKVAVFVQLFRQQAELQRLNDALTQSQRELSNANDQLEQAVQTLRDNNLMLDSFAFSVSHDLRAPLRHADCFTSALSESCAAKLNDDEKRYLALVRNSVSRMSQMIEDLLSFCRANRAEIRKQRVDVERMVHEVIEELRPSFVGREIVFKVGSLPTTHGDPSMLRQVWTNLLSNAVKYTGQKQSAQIDIACDRGPTNAYVVKDNGAGFEMQYAGRLFGVFQRLHLESEFQGTGAGLAIVKRIIERHGGTIRAEAKVNEGATFTFTLPKIEEAEAAPGQSPATATEAVRAPAPVGR
jgi:signal transduction histidine kinase